jgi:hypothetical protein
MRITGGQSLSPVRFPLAPRFGRSEKPDSYTPEEAEVAIANLQPKSSPLTLGANRSDINIKHMGLDDHQGEFSRGKDDVLLYKAISTTVPSWLNKVPMQPGTTYVLRPRQMLTLGTDGVVLDIKDHLAEDALRSFIDKGLERLKNKEYEAAKDHFYSPESLELARKLGVSYVHDTMLFLWGPMINDKSVDIAGRILSESTYYNPGMRRLKILNFHMNPEAKYTQAEVALNEAAYQETAMMAADHWLQVLQHYSGKNLVSSHARDVDTAFYLRQQEVPLTERYVNQRGRERFKDYLLAKMPWRLA